MYYIITLSTGQPLILYIENKNVYLYSIVKGRINNKNLLFNDYKAEMQVINNKFIIYQTIENKIKFYQVNNCSFNLLFTLPSNAKVSILNNDVFVIYESQNILYCIKCSSFNKSSLLLKDVTFFEVCVFKDFILLKTKDSFYTINSNIKVSKLNLDSQDLTQYQEMLYEKEKEIGLLKSSLNNITNQYNDLSIYTGKLQDEIRKYKYVQ